MHSINHASRIVVGLALFSLSTIGCGGSSAPAVTPAYVPQNSATTFAPEGKKQEAIHSTCGDKIHIVLLGFVGCKFAEHDYGGNFKVTVATKGLVGIDPKKGTKDTTFTVTGLIAGKGYFLVRDSQKNILKIRVRVTTL